MRAFPFTRPCIYQLGPQVQARMYSSFFLHRTWIELATLDCIELHHMELHREMGVQFTHGEGKLELCEMSLVSSFSKWNRFTISKWVQLGGFFFATSKQLIKKIYAIPRRKQNGGRSGKRHRPISLLESALILKNARVLACSENGKDFFYVARRDAGEEVPVLYH